MKNHPNRNKIKDWPKHLKAFRAKHKLTQKQLANALQISLRNIENWEADFSKPPAYLRKALDQIARKHGPDRS
jgi:DNA-binding transcriptional regulator YiaG